MVRIFVGVTHKPWFDLLSGLAPAEVNFWQPSGTGEFKALRPGDLFLFKLKAPWNAIAGGGVFAHASLAPLSLAWEAFGVANGNPTLADMRGTIAKLKRGTPLGGRDDPTIGCRILTEPFFWPEERWIAAPASFSSNTVVGRATRPATTRAWRYGGPSRTGSPRRRRRQAWSGERGSARPRSCGGVSARARSASR